MFLSEPRIGLVGEYQTQNKKLEEELVTMATMKGWHFYSLVEFRTQRRVNEISFREWSPPFLIFYFARNKMAVLFVTLIKAHCSAKKWNQLWDGTRAQLPNERNKKIIFFFLSNYFFCNEPVIRLQMLIWQIVEHWQCWLDIFFSWIH